MLKTLVLISLFNFGIANCPGEHVEWNSLCYIFQKNHTDFESAERACQNLGGHLTSIHDAFLNSFLQQNAYEVFPTSSDFWMGLQRFEDTYFWVDETSVDFTSWYSGEPIMENGHDAAIFSMEKNGNWLTADMSTHRPSVCRTAAA